jgi:hypothetical protein
VTGNVTSKSQNGAFERWRFLKAAATAVAGAAGTVASSDGIATPEFVPRANAVAPEVSRDAQTGRVPITEAPATDHPSSDYMVDVLKSLGFEYVFSNPANAIGSLHESLINYGQNTNPQFVTCAGSVTDRHLNHLRQTPPQRRLHAKPAPPAQNGRLCPYFCLLATLSRDRPDVTVCATPTPQRDVSPLP